MFWWMLGGVLAIVLVVAVVQRRRRAGGELTSMVLLRTTPATVTEDQVRAAARAVFQDEGGAIALPPGDFPPGLAGGFAVTLGGTPVFVVINAHRPYVEDPVAGSRRFRDARARDAFAAHKAWVSVDVAGGAPDASIRKTVLLSMGVIALKLMDGRTSLLYSTWLDRVAFPSDMKRASAAGDLNAVFGA